MATSPSSYVNAPSAVCEPSKLAGMPTYWRDRLTSYLKCAGALEVILVGAASAIGLLSLYYATGEAVGFLRIGMITGAVVGAYVYFRHAMQLATWIALTAVLLFLCHPLSVTRSDPSVALSETTPLLIAPWMMLLSRSCMRSPRSMMILGQSAIMGLLLATCVPSWQVFVTLLIACLTLELVLLEKNTFHINALKRLGASIIIAAGTGMAMSAANSVFPVAVNQPETMAEPTGITAPLAWVDRNGVLSSQLGKWSEDSISDGGRHYLGCCTILLCLIAVWPSQRHHQTLRAAGLIAMAMFFTWLTLGQNLYEQLQRMFEFATVRRYVEPSTLHVLGLMSLALVTLGVVVFLSVATLAGRCRPWSLVGILLASTVVMFWCRTSVTALTSLSGSAAAMPILNTLTAFLLTCGAAVGIRCVCHKNLSMRGKLVSSVIVLALLATDVFPYMQKHRDQADGLIVVPQETESERGSAPGLH
ncbi:MAG: hypothetical protein MI923_05940 [Phycisphaerales bacterium]|nr:hypothetical protein [Phycisphaerales bacterium]